MPEADAELDGYTLFTDATRGAELVAWSEGKGVDPEISLLAAELARAAIMGPRVDAAEQTAFIDQFVTNATGRDTAGAAFRWLAWLWADAPDCMRDRVPDEGDRAAIMAVVALHRRAAATPVAASEWRAARRTFRNSVSAHAPAAVTQTIEASMWDLATTPGAIADAGATWLAMSSEVDAVEQSGWSWAAYLDYQAAWDAFAAYHDRKNKVGASEDAADAQPIEELGPEPTIPEEVFAASAAMNQARFTILPQRLQEMRRALIALLRA